MSTKFIRKKNRLRHKEIYKSNNSFFVTICVEQRRCIFVEENFNSPNPQTNNGQIQNGQINLSSTGKIVEEMWLNIPNIFENTVSDDFVVIPNHFHGIITFLDIPTSKLTKKESDLGKIIKYFKAKTTLKIKEVLVEEKLVSPKSHNNESHNGELKFASTRELIKNHNTIWQKSFYDHIIRDEKDLQRIKEYIQNNPLKWEIDILNPNNEQKHQKWLIAKNIELQLK